MFGAEKPSDTLENVGREYKKTNTILLSQEVFKSICLKRAADRVSDCQKQNDNDTKCEKQIQQFVQEIGPEPSTCTTKLLVD